MLRVSKTSSGSEATQFRTSALLQCRAQLVVRRRRLRLCGWHLVREERHKRARDAEDRILEREEGGKFSSGVVGHVAARKMPRRSAGERKK